MTDQNTTTLPKFDKPPVVETVLGVEFSGLDKWGVLHFGLFWDRMRDRFPKWDVKLPLGSQIENFGGEVPIKPDVQVLTEPEMRCWFVGEDGKVLLQIQKDRLLYNWRKINDDDVYPHYEESIRPGFELVWNEFNDFVKQEELGEINILQCEVSYINHLIDYSISDSTKNLDKIFTSIADIGQGEFLPIPEAISFDSRYQIPDKAGRLHVSVKPAVRNSDGAGILQFTLTARTKPKESNFTSLMASLDIGREWVVRGFTDLTTAKMHDIWKRRN